MGSHALHVVVAHLPTASHLPVVVSVCLILVPAYLSAINPAQSKVHLCSKGVTSRTWLLRVGGTDVVCLCPASRGCTLPSACVTSRVQSAPLTDWGQPDGHANPFLFA